MEDFVEGQLIVCLNDHTWYRVDFDSVPASTIDIVQYLEEQDKLPKYDDGRVVYIGCMAIQLMNNPSFLKDNL